MSGQIGLLEARGSAAKAGLPARSERNCGHKLNGLPRVLNGSNSTFARRVAEASEKYSRELSSVLAALLAPAGPSTSSWHGACSYSRWSPNKRRSPRR